MSIATCRHCKNTFWRYRKDHPPRGYCSIPHAEAGPAKKREPMPDKPDLVLFHLRSHRVTEHRDRFFLQDHNCEECDKLNEQYQVSLAFWIDHPMQCA